MGGDMHPDDQPPSDVAAGIRKMFEAEADRVETERRAAGLMSEAMGRAVDRMLTALKVVNLQEWRERKNRNRQS